MILVLVFFERVLFHQHMQHIAGGTVRVRIFLFGPAMLAHFVFSFRHHIHKRPTVSIVTWSWQGNIDMTLVMFG